MYRNSQLIASTDGSFSLKNDHHTIAVPFMNDQDMDRLLEQLRSDSSYSNHRLSLHLENIKGNDSLPIIDIYLNLQQEDTPKENNHVGSMGLYGLGESSTDGTGQNRIFDVGQVFYKVRGQSNWSKQQFKVSLIPSQLLPEEANLSIGRVALYLHES